jgi:hypothetical protein
MVRRVAAADGVGDLVVFGQHARHLAKAGGDGFEHRVVGGELRFLRHVGDGEAGLAPDFAVVERSEAGQRLEQAGLAATVAADEANPLAGIDLHRGVVQQGYMPVGKTGAIERNDRHGNRVIRGDREGARL